MASVAGFIVTVPEECISYSQHETPDRSWTRKRSNGTLPLEPHPLKTFEECKKTTSHGSCAGAWPYNLHVTSGAARIWRKKFHAANTGIIKARGIFAFFFWQGPL